MEGFTVVDGVVALVIVISAILAYSRGFVRETLSIVGWIAAVVLAYMFAPQVEPLVKEIPILNDFLGESCELAIIAAFAGVFVVALIVISLFTPIFAGAVQRSALGGIDQGLGFLFGVARGVLLVAVALIVYDRVAANDPVPMVEDSRSAKVFATVTENLSDQIPQDAPGWIVEKYEALVGDCGGTPVSTEDATTETGSGN
jgi:membrane protein required for colicin V production